MKRFCVLNIGNTHTQIAIGITDGKTVEWESSENYNTSDIPFKELPVDILTIYASVVPQVTAIMQTKMPHAIPCFAQNVPFVDFSYAPPTLGMDRIINCAALAQKHSHGIIIDAGTAVTLEVVKDNKFIGGAILPGLGILAKAMHDHTSALPAINCPPAPDLATVTPELLTVNAMQIGIQSAVAAGTLQLLKNFLQLLPANAPVYVCGGNRNSILNQKAYAVMIDGGNEFTLQGLAAVALHYLNKE